MYDGMKLYRAVVAASSPSTGAVYVSIPSVLGPTTTIGVSTIGRGPVNGVWAVPSVGDQVVVAVEDDKFSNLYLAYPAPQQTLTIPDGSITAAKLASDAVTTAKILDANVTAGKLASNAVTTAKILDSNVTTSKINDGAVTNAKLGLTELKIRRTANQTIEDFSYIDFDTEDSDLNGLFTIPAGWTENSSVVIPSGYAGLYATACRIVRSSTGAGWNTVMTLETESDQIIRQFGSSNTVGHIFANLYLPEGATVKIGITTGGNINYTARLWMTRIMD